MVGLILEQGAPKMIKMSIQEINKKEHRKMKKEQGKK